MDKHSLTAPLNQVQPECPTAYAEHLDYPITSVEVLNELRARAHHKAAGIDGFCLEFYTANWETIQADLTQLLNHMFLHKRISPQQKHEILICLPKSKANHTPES